MQRMLHWHTDYPTHAEWLRPIAIAPSLTQTLSQLGTFSVQLDTLGETNQHDFADFRLPETVFSRRVTLLLDDMAVVHAQSVCTMQSQWREILHCGNTPLGTILFSGSLKLTRSEMQFATPKHYLLARRSSFDWHGDKLYLAEYFLPAMANIRAA